MRELSDGEVVPLSSVFSRREFCRIAGTGLVVLGAGCGDGLERVGTGSLEDTGSPSGPTGGNPPPQNPDLAMKSSGGGNHNPDLAMSGGNPPPPPDLAMPGGGGMNTCGNSGATDTNTKAASIASGSAVYIRSQAAFLCRDGGGWFAVSSQCTHAGATLSFTGNGFHCPRHGANFALGGAVQSGPNGGPLDHYQLCMTGNGTIGLDVNTTVSASTRYMF